MDLNEMRRRFKDQKSKPQNNPQNAPEVLAIVENPDEQQLDDTCKSCYKKAVEVGNEDVVKDVEGLNISARVKAIVSNVLKTFYDVERLENKSAQPIVSNSLKNFADVERLENMSAQASKGSITNRVRYKINPSDCICCGACAPTCPYNAISSGSNGYIIQPSRCVGCGVCVDECPMVAIVVGG